ncbi:efflux RND transporter periplasmic adaptor subunit [Candidatus Solirubrobacter pratensis]|uniref:efflux RND transporter periplasmic adaptor subunit n=1 Tax=Candidatus Solirubrobacter pratensis TaxID=1298857 RepID=UPI00048949C3|nr:HlyD family efflux transporter periplasmic adaptor subunit [Candidatus Solirubrobacter pratensis]
MTLRDRPSPTLIALSALAATAVAIAAIVVGSPVATADSGRTVTVARGVIQSTVSGSGNLAPANQLELNFGTSGDVTKISVEEGEHVSKGQLLARIDDSSAKVAVAQAKADLASAEDQQATASTSTASASAAAAVDSAQLALKSAEQALADTALRAPVPGTVTTIAGAVGDAVGSGSGTSSSSGESSSGTSSSSGASSSASADGAATSTSTTGSSGFITLAQLSRLKMDVSVGEADVGKIKVGQAATVTVDAVPGLKLAGHVAAIGVLSSSSSSSTASAVSFPVTIALDQASTTARAGMSASADIVVSQVSGLSVPSQAVSGSAVMLVENGKQVRTPVQTGVAGDTTTQIVSGVKAGDQVYVQSPSAAAGAAATGSASASGQQGARPGRGGGGFGGGGFGGGGFGGGGRG